MTVPAKSGIDMKRRYIEMEFSDSIFKALPLIMDFSQKKKISSFVIYPEEEAFHLIDPLLAFCSKAGEKHFDCQAVIPFEHRELLPRLRENGIRRQVRIGTGDDLHLFLAEKDHFPETSVELYYDDSRQKAWDMTHAMDLCRQSSVECCFGCSNSFISASSEDLQILCGGNSAMPFPEGSNCFRFAESLFLDRSGKCFACRGLKDLPISNIFSDSFEDDIENSTILSYYENFYRKIKDPCRSCSNFSACAGCRGRAHRYSSDAFGADPGCLHNRSRLDVIARLPLKTPEKYLPHKKPMLMVSELLRVQDNNCETLSIIQPDNPFLLANGQLDAAALIEIGAQSMAFLGTFLEPDPKQGMLVEIKRFEYSGVPVYVNTCLKIYCRKIYEMPPWGLGSFKIYTADDRLAASGEVKICQIDP